MTKMTEILFRPGLLMHKLGIKITPSLQPLVRRRSDRDEKPVLCERDGFHVSLETCGENLNTPLLVINISLNPLGGLGCQGQPAFREPAYMAD